MKTITLQEAYKFIEDARAVVVDDEAVTFPSLWDFTGEDDNIWLHLTWEDSDFHEFSVSFIEEHTEIKFDGSSIYMKDDNDDDIKLTLLVPMNKLAEISI